MILIAALVPTVTSSFSLPSLYGAPVSTVKTTSLHSAPPGTHGRQQVDLSMP